VKALNIRYMTGYSRCSYKCPYCIVGHGQQKDPGVGFDKTLFMKIINNISSLPYDINLRPGVYGEMFLSDTLRKGFGVLANSENIKSLNLITNLSLSVKQYHKYLFDYPTYKIAIVGSCHPSQIKNWSQWYEKVAVFDLFYDFTVCLICYPPELDKVAEVAAELKKAGISYFLQPFLGRYRAMQYPYSYSTKELKIIKKHVYSDYDYDYLFKSEMPGFCCAGSEYIYIDPLGKVYPCGGVKYASPIGDLSKDVGFSLFPSHVFCIANHCHCDTEMVNTLYFKQTYIHTGINQHKYRKR